MKKVLFTVVSILLVSACSSLQGIVRDKSTGSPIASAVVKVNDDSSTTDGLGRYEIKGDTGDTMMINAPGYNIYTKTVKSDDEIVDVELTKQ